MTVTTTKFRCIGIMGDSWAAGWAGINEMLTDAPHLTTTSSLTWKNIYAYTSSQPWNFSPDTEPVATNIEDGAWLELTINNPVSPAAAHPHDSPYLYANNQGVPIPNWLWDSSIVAAGTGTIVGFEVPVCWHLSQYWSDQIGLVKVAAPGTYAMRFDAGGSATPWLDPGDPLIPLGTYEGQVDPNFGHYAWWTPADQWDFDPSTDRLYGRFIDKAIAGKDALPDTTTMSLDVVIVAMGNNDLGVWGSPRIVNWGSWVKAFIQKLRKDIKDNNLSTLPQHQVGIVWIGIHPVYGSPLNDTMNDAVRELAEDDPWLTFIDPDGIEMQAVGGAHPSAAGFNQLGQSIFEAIQDMDLDPYDAMDNEDRWSVSQLKDAVKLEYARGKSNTDLDDDVLLAQCNRAMHTVLDQMGDYAYFLRRRHSITLTGGGRSDPVTLPKKVDQLIRIEDVNDVTYPLHWEEIGRTEGGRIQIVIPNQTTGTYVIHYLRMPRDLETDDELVPMPHELMHWLISETCLRLASAAGNPLQIAAFRVQAANAQDAVMKKVSATQRGRRDRLYTQRRLPDPLHRRRIRRWDIP